MNVVTHPVAPRQLLLDPNNYRFHDLPNFRHVTNMARFSEPGVQERTLQILQDTESFELEALKDSIATNGYVPLEQVVVEKFGAPLNPEEQQYLVIEGNRRVAAVRALLREHEAGARDLPQPILDSIGALPVAEVVGTEQERKQYQQTLMAIRHIAGIREWGAYQQATLIADLYENEERSFSRVAERVGISSREVARRYRAIKALQQMEEDEEFSESAAPRLYSFFHEAVSQPKVREWLGFSDETFRAESADNRRAFYELMSPRDVDGEVLPAKLQNANRQVRQLKDIVDKPVPLRMLLDPERPFEDAVRAAEEENVQDEEGALEHSLAVALNALREPGIDAWLEPTERARELWSQFVRVVDHVRRLIPENAA